MTLTQKRQAILGALSDGALTREELQAKLVESGAMDAYGTARQMSGEIEWRMIEVDGEPTPQYVLRSVGFDAQPEAPIQPESPAE